MSGYLTENEAREYWGAPESRIVEVADSVVEGCVAACGEFSTAELQAVADDPRYRDGWPGSLIREYLNTWRENGERP